LIFSKAILTPAFFACSTTVLSLRIPISKLGFFEKSGEELEQRFPDWEIQRFTPNEIVLYKEVNGFCNEHFLLKEEDGYIAIYKLDDNNNAEFFQTTEIYARVSRKQKDEAIANAYRDVGIKNPEPKLWEKDDELLDFLSNLCSKR